MIQRITPKREAKQTAGKVCDELSSDQIDALARFLLSLPERDAIEIKPQKTARKKSKKPTRPK
ncbi:hypothetical protein LOC67_09380 [Stieleria sp. JC731]|uniref:hypothetical protein n=1 Tax=Pirellulaceae TaxID=2691357 RepID=UPI001E5B03AC|nr:hypothetical protein [Stieleria sp. JC731]MCC9600775.1 hypothetical protein [Stieleria sp. JC731]